LSKNKVTVNKKRLEDLKKSLKNARVKVGVIKKKVYADGLSVAEVAVLHEFGSTSKGVPERSFIRETMAQQEKALMAYAKKEANKVLDGTQSTKTAIEKLGIFAQAEILKKFTNNDWQENSKLTIKNKKSAMPLIDTGQLRQSITWEVI